MSNKTKKMGKIEVPDVFYRDFLRGVFDGDGSSYSYFDQRWRSSFMFYICYVSASRRHIQWIQGKNEKLFQVRGYITKVKNKEFYQLRYAKKEGLVLAAEMYYHSDVPCLVRKKKKLLASIDKSAQVL